MKTAIAVALLWLISLVPIFKEGKGQAILSDFAFVPRASQSLTLPFWFYLMALLMLLLRVAMLLGVPNTAKWHRWRPLIGWLTGLVALIYFYNLSALMPLSRDNWEAPVGGLCAAVLWKFYTAWMLARHDDFEESAA